MNELCVCVVQSKGGKKNNNQMKCEKENTQTSAVIAAARKHLDNW